MELIIRSQDKTILSKMQNIIIRENQNENNETNYAIVDIYTIGIYKTKERALEVLDEIQNLIKNQYIVECKPLMNYRDIERLKADLMEGNNAEFIMQPPICKINPINPNIVVYEMPKE